MQTNQNKIFRFNIIATGSDGNCVVATFSDLRQVVFDLGKGCYKESQRLNYKMLPSVDFSKVDNVLITHEHQDHCGDYGKVEDIDFPKTLRVEKLAVRHDVENFGYLVFNENTKEVAGYFTDYSSIPKASLDRLIELVSDKEWSYMLGMELSYCFHIYAELGEGEKFGLGRHCSDFVFFNYARKILEANPAVNIITLHASRRTSANGGAVAPKDYLRQKFSKFQPSVIRFGEAYGMAGSYNYIKGETFGGMK